ncbi:MAG: site-specific integrase [Candidatus Igneacidithiobacillus chanchocoensis]
MASIERRQNEDGTVSYRAKIRLRGHPVQSATFERLSDAKRWAQQVESDIRAGRHFATTEARKHTLAEAITRYKAEHLAELRDGERRGRQLDWWAERAGAFSLVEITPARITELQGKLAAEPIPGKGGTMRHRSPATINRYLAALSGVLSVAAKQWQWLERSPMESVAKRKEPPGRVRFLSDFERDALLRETARHEDLHLFTLLSLSTGARKSEIMGLEWRQIDMQRRVIVLEHTKNKERRSLPIVAPVLALLQKRVRRLDSPLLFPSHRNPRKPLAIEAPWREAVAAAGISGFRIHDMRHSCASWLAMAGVPMGTIAEILGHKSMQMTKRYSHLSTEHIAGVLENVTGKMLGGAV